MTREEMQKLIRPWMKDRRYRHSLCVAQEAENLANLYGVDPQRAYTAGVLHDIMKEETHAEQLKLIQSSGIMFNWSQIASPNIYHGFAAAAYLKQERIVQDEKILSAIMYHTTGKRYMSVLEKIVFTADYTGTDRTFPEAAIARELAHRDLDAAVLYIVKETIASLIRRNSPISSDSLDLYNQLQIEAEQRKGESDI